MAEISERVAFILENLVSRGVAPDIESALEYCVVRGWASAESECALESKDEAELAKRFAELESGEGRVFKDADALIQAVWEKVEVKRRIHTSIS